MKRFPRQHARGFTFVELLIGSAVVVLMFGGLFASIQYSIKLIAFTKAKTGALAVANEQIEYLRSLRYADVGTVFGIPAGPVPQNATTSLNGVSFSKRTFIQYVDAPDDGLGSLDQNGILADFKEVKIEVSWDIGYGTSSIMLISYIVPPGIETTAGGGSLMVRVFNADVQPVSGASVRLYNNTTTSTIDVLRSTNTSGIALFSGAPAAANYEITVTNTGYSTDQTYSATTSNPNPTTPPVAVLEGTVSSMNFQIDRLSHLTVKTAAPPTYGSFLDSFDDDSKIESISDANVTAGAVVLLGSPGSYALQGMLRGTSTAPNTLARWDRAIWTTNTSLLTTVTVQIYAVTGTGTYALIPDSDLPGNSAGFTSGSLDLSSLDTATYSSLALGAVLETLDANETPELSSWEIIYTTAESSIPNINFTLRGTKVIGMTELLVPIPKYAAVHNTDSSGSVVISNLEWDQYSAVINTPGYDIAQACPQLPLVVNPGTAPTLTLTLVPASANSLRVTVVDPSGGTIAGATVDLTRPGFSDSKTTTPCGQVFFGSGLSIEADYEVHVVAPGYSPRTITNVSVDGDSVLVVTVSP